MKIELKHKIKNDHFTEYIYDQFDIQNREESNVTIEANLENIPDKWNIGVIYGGSGTGKTTILKHCFKKEIDKAHFDNSISLISNFDWLEPKEATLLLTQMGLASVPCWLRPHNTLSNGEQYRANLAYIVGKAKENDVILIDEYTSVVDRDVAKSMSNALQKYIRRNNKKIVLASCHFDIMEWLQPDWIYSPNKRRIERSECLRLERPKIQLEIFRCRYETWRIFKQHHYLTDQLNPASQCFLILTNDKPIGFMAFLPFPGVGDSKTRRLSRMVILPDFQGLGIGKKVFNYICSLYWKEKHQMYVRTVSPGLGEMMKNDKQNWIETAGNGKIPGADTSGKKLLARPSYSYKWIGNASQDDTSIITFNADAYKNVSQLQQSLF
jgi:ABC-type lipoprotein export system ATPase subunit/GNAT superfamily N-acetyltransferase